MNGTAAQVINKIGWPGETDFYRVDIRVPWDLLAGQANLQLFAAWIPGNPCRIPAR